MPVLDLVARPEAVPRTRDLVRGLLDDWGAADLRDDVDLVLTELLANAVLHAPGPARVVVERDEDGVRLEVHDSSPVPPRRQASGQAATTGRGLHLVDALCSRWGVAERGDGEPGKQVWCVVSGTGAGELADEDVDVDALLAAFDDDLDAPVPLAAAGPAAEPLVEVRVGSAPAGLLLEAKDHLDGVLRELALAVGDGDLPGGVAQDLTAAAAAFAPARNQVRGLLNTAVGRRDQRVDLVFSLPRSLAEPGERFLQALRTADTFARDRRMLSLESPVEHRVLREWYVEGLVAGLRGAPGEPEAFEARLLRELHVLEQRHRAAELGAQLQRVTALLAAAESVQEIADTAVSEGVLAVGASGGLVTRLEGGLTVAVSEAGDDAGLADRYLDVPAEVRPRGPSSEALETGRAVWVEGQDEVRARYPHLHRLQPDVQSLAVLPLQVAGEVVGALRLSWSSPHVFSDTEREFLTGLAVQTAQAVGRADALQRLRDLRDELDRLLGAAGHIESTDLGVLRSLYADAPVGIAVFDAEGRYLRVNEVLAAANGRPAAEHVGLTVGEVLVQAPPQEVAGISGLLDRVLRDGEPLEQEVADTARGAARVWRTSWFPVRDPEGRVEAAVALAVDITAQRRAEDRTRALALLGDRLSRERTPEGVLDAVAAAVVPDLADWAVVHLRDERDRVECALVRHPDPARERLLARAAELVRVDLGQPVGAGRVLATGQTLPLPRVDVALLAELGVPDGEAAEVLLDVQAGAGAVVPLVAAGRTVGALSVSRQGGGLTAADLAVVEDVGRRAGAALEGVAARLTTSRLEIALEAADVGSFDWDLRTGVLSWDERMFRLFEVDPATELSIDDYLARLHPEDVERVTAALQATVDAVGELEVLYRVRRQDGSVRWLEARGRALPGPGGSAERVVGTAVDVTDRQESSARAERTLELMGDAFFSLDRAWRFTYVNREAERLLDRSREDLLGREVWQAFPDARGGRFEQEYRRALQTGETARFEQWFAPLGRHFEVRAHPGPEGLSVYFADVSARQATELQRDRALERLGLLNAIGAELSATLDVDEALARLADLLVPSLADLVSVDLADGGDVRSGRAVVTVSSDPAKAEAMERAEQVLPRRHNPGSAVHQVLHGAPVVHVVVTPEHLATVARDADHLDLYLQVRMRHAVVVPLLARGRVLGALSLIRTGADAQPFTPDDLALAQDVGRRAGLMVDNAAQYTAQRTVAEGLQRSLLPDLPHVPGLALGAAYEPSSSAALVGGDWYDAFVLPDGAVGLVVGDVMGHDLAAAAAMGQLRSVLRTCAADGDRPGLVLDRLDRLVTSFAMADLATVVYARLDRRADGSGLLTWANAGHPPPLVLAPDGTTEYLDDAGSIMIGAGLGQAREQAERVLAPGSTVLLFTDGLVERRGHDLDAQLDRLAATAAAVARETADPAELCERLLDTVRRDADTDDAAAIALTLG